MNTQENKIIITRQHIIFKPAKGSKPKKLLKKIKFLLNQLKVFLNIKR